MNPADLIYSEEHEWLRIEQDDTCVIGITEFAADSLGDIVFVELPSVGTKLEQFQKMGEVESVKAVSDLYSPISGLVTEINESLDDNPELVNEEAFGQGWMLRVTITDSSELNKLMTNQQYEDFLAQQQ